jgi:AraC family transcriptional activator of pobA
MAIEIKDKLLPQNYIKVVQFDPTKNITRPHKHNGYLELVLLSSTSGKHVIDGRTIRVQPPCLLVIRKDNVHHWELANPVHGYVILVKDKFIDQSLDFEIPRLVAEIYHFDTIYLPELGPLWNLMELIAAENNQICQEGLFKTILAKALEYSSDSPKNRSLSDAIYTQFCTLLGEKAPVVNHVAYYATRLNTSPQNLNAVCKKNVSLTASQVIAGYIIKEAQRQLYYTPKSVSEVAFALGFSDKSNFTKYFKRYTGITPGEFRTRPS